MPLDVLAGSMGGNPFDLPQRVSRLRRTLGVRSLEAMRGDYGDRTTAAAIRLMTRALSSGLLGNRPSGTPCVRVSWIDDPSVADAGDVTFNIRALRNAPVSHHT
jgi:hypothetical protein